MIDIGGMLYAKVTGLDLRDIRYGAPLVCQDESQLEAMTQLFEELEIQGVAIGVYHSFEGGDGSFPGD